MKFKVRFVVLIALLAVSCYKAPLEPLRLDGNMLTVDNQTATDWTNVEVWVNSSAGPAGGSTGPFGDGLPSQLCDGTPGMGPGSNAPPGAYGTPLSERNCLFRGMTSR